MSSIEPGQTPEPADLLPEIRDGLKESLMTRPSHVRWLIAEVEQLRAQVDELLTDLDGRDEKARRRWIKKQEKELRLRSMEFRNGSWEMSLEGARDMAAAYTAMAKTLLGDAPNYSETKLSFDVKVAESPELYTIVVQRHAPGALTPHEARQKAEAERNSAWEQLSRLREWIGTTEHDAAAGELLTLVFDYPEPEADRG